MQMEEDDFAVENDSIFAQERAMFLHWTTV